MSFILGIIVYVAVLGRMDARLPWPCVSPERT